MSDHKVLLQQAYQAIERLKARLDTVERTHKEPIAIIGMACRTPGGANTPDAFWHLLSTGVDAIVEIPRDRWDADAWYDADPDAPGKTYVRAGGFVSGVDQFDAAFFGISPREATSMDPQQRFLLEVTWEALEHAGQPADRLAGSPTGVFVGACHQDYLLLQQRVGLAATSDPYSGTGSTLSVAAGRISYALGLAGPTLAVDTACSSSLVAIHLACQNLRTGRCRMALAGGVNLLLTPEPTVYLSKTRALAPDGRCKSFAAAADGYARSEGCAIVVLKRLSDARADGDRIIAVIRGTATNHDGRSSGLTVPSGPAQEAVIREALRDGGIAPEEVGYVEAHGTGTPLGDPIEVRAIAAVLGGPARTEPLRLGSVKTNVGHLEGAAGVIGLIKAALSLEHEAVPPHLHCEQPSAHIPWRELPITIPTRPTPWPRDPAKRRIAGVSAFGFSGSNAHVVLEEAPVAPAAAAGPLRPSHVLTLSAKTPEALRALAGRYREALGEDVALPDFAYSANTGRARHPHRLAVIAGSTAAARASLDGFLAGRAGLEVQTGRVEGAIAPDVAFLFTGQGSQYAGMGRQLFETQPTFRRSLERADELLRPLLGRSLIAVLHAGPDEAAVLDHTAVAQPALFALEYALAELWRSWGVVPSAVLGHSVGEYVAACVAGVISFEDGLRLIAERGRLMGALPPGGTMMAVFADEAKVRAAVEAGAERVSIAAVNGPAEVVISGARDAVDAVIARLGAGGGTPRPLRVSHAFHSPLMDPILDPFERLVSTVALSPPKLTLVSNLTGEPVAPDAMRPGYFRRHLREPVRFAAGMQALHRKGYRVFVEIGPSPALLGLGRRAVVDDGQAWLPSLRKGGDDWRELLAALTALHLRGVPVDWNGFDRDYPRRRLVLPSYPFQRRRYWIAAGPSRPDSAVAPAISAPQPTVQDERSAEPIARWLHGLAWRRADRTAIRRGEPSSAGRWLLCADRGGVAAELARLLEMRGATCTQLAPGEESTISLATSPAGGFRGVIHLGGLDDEGEPSGDNLQAAQARGTLSVLALIQRLAEATPAPRLWIVTRRAQALPMDRGPVALAHAPLWGLGRVIALEHPDLWGGLIDVDAAPAGEVAAALLEEIWDPRPDDRARSAAKPGSKAHGDGSSDDDPGAEDQVAYRGGVRHVARLERLEQAIRNPDAASPPAPVRLEHLEHPEQAIRNPDEAPPPAPLRLRADRSYLIAGGLGGLGLTVAQWMVANGARHLALLGRTPVDEQGGERLAAVRALKAAGARVIVQQADLGRVEEVVRAVGELARSLPPLAGVVHAAGLIDDGMLVRQDPARFARVMAPKVAGAWNLHAGTLGQPLEFFALFSSAAAILGSPGQGNYAAANAFLDALAHHRRVLGLPAVSINWGPWADVGMWAALGTRGRVVRGVGLISPARGTEALARLLAGDAAQVAVLPIAWRTFATVLPVGQAPRLLADLLDEPDAAPARAGERRDGEIAARFFAASPMERPAIVEGFLAAQVAAAMRSDPKELPRDGNLLELGMDSLMVVEVAHHLKREFHLTLYPREFYEHPSLASLSGYLASELERAHGIAGPVAATVAPHRGEALPSLPARRGGVAIDRPVRRIPGIAFLLSSPRAGSTLLRVMLAGHPALFCPPELHLLGFDTLREREAALGTSYLGEGLQRAIMELEGLDAARGQRRVQGWLDEDLAIHAVYERLQALAGARLVVDKSPTYASSLETLEHAEAVFDGARYLFLFRHPYAVIESFVRKRMDKLVGAGDTDPYALAERIWVAANENTRAFLRRIPRERGHAIRYEDLVREPERVMREACDFLQIPFDPAVLSPYAGNRMADGVHPQSVAIGDPDFLAHTGVDRRLGERWRDVHLPRPLGDAARRVAAEMGYELPAEPAAARGPDEPLARGPREGFVEVRGLRLCTLSWGPEDGPVVVCLHGFLDHAGSMAAVAQRLARRGLRVVAPDLRGHGRSGHVGAGGSYHLVDFVADLDALARTLGPAPFTLVGHSFGAGIAGLFAGVRPERLAQLVLVELSIPTDGRASESTDRLSTHLDYLASAQVHPTFPDLATAVERLRAVTPIPPAQALATIERVTEPCDGGIRWRWDPLLRTRAGVTFHGLELPPERFRELVGRARCPVTLVYGDDSDLRRVCQAAIPGGLDGRARRVVLRGGHNLHLDSPAELAEVIAAAAAGAAIPQTS